MTALTSDERRVTLVRKYGASVERRSYNSLESMLHLALRFDSF